MQWESIQAGYTGKVDTEGSYDLYLRPWRDLQSASLCQCVRIPPLVQQLLEQYIFGLDVCVHNAFCVRVRERFEHLSCQDPNLRNTEWLEGICAHHLVEIRAEKLEN